MLAAVRSAGCQGAVLSSPVPWSGSLALTPVFVLVTGSVALGTGAIVACLLTLLLTLCARSHPLLVVCSQGGGDGVGIPLEPLELPQQFRVSLAGITSLGWLVAILCEGRQRQGRGEDRSGGDGAERGRHRPAGTGGRCGCVHGVYLLGSGLRCCLEHRVRP